MIKLRAIDSAVLVGAAVGITTAFVNPVYSGASLAFMGGIIGGASLQDSRNRQRFLKEQEAERVGQTFATLYDKNRGLIDPVELAFISQTPLQYCHEFLTNLAESSNGQKVGVKEGTGVVFNFPHTANALDALSKNASAWAENQQKDLQLELQRHKQAIQMLQAQNAAAKMQQNGAQEAKPDPWNTVQPGV